jgi:hypothetical protein
MFRDWENFYILMGGSAGALIGLLFVVVTLTGEMKLERERALRAADHYMTPTVVMFCTVLVTGALATAPRLPAAVQGALLGLIAVGGVAYGVWLFLAIRARMEPTQHWSDPWFYGVAPGACFALLALSDALALADLRLVAYGVALSIVAMLLTGIRNAWDLITWMASGRRSEAQPQSE